MSRFRELSRVFEGILRCVGLPPPVFEKMFEQTWAQLPPNVRFLFRAPVLNQSHLGTHVLVSLRLSVANILWEACGSLDKRWCNQMIFYRHMSAREYGVFLPFRGSECRPWLTTPTTMRDTHHRPAERKNYNSSI